MRAGGHVLCFASILVGLTITWPAAPALAQPLSITAGDTTSVGGRRSEQGKPDAGTAVVGAAGPLAETVQGALGGNAANLPAVPLDQIDDLKIRPFPHRHVPRLFWYYGDGLDVIVFRQKQPAPLVFVIAGTGASSDSQSVQILGRLLFARGMNVAMIPSPSHSQFIVTASTSSVPGLMGEDARDLMRVMELVRSKLTPGMSITGYKLAGFSLGAMHAAFVAELDSQLHAFDFDRVVLVNPPLSLDHSITLIDEMLDRYVRRDPAAVDRFIQTVFAAFAEAYAQAPTSDLSPEVFYRAFGLVKDRFDLLEMLVGLSFRISVANMAFTSDVMTHSGYFIPADAHPGITNSLTDVFKVSLDHSLRDYIRYVVMPYVARTGGAGAQADSRQLLAEASLESIGGYLRQASRIGVVTDADDVILAPGDLAAIRGLFGPRAVVLPQGGHGGSLGNAAFTAAFYRLMGLAE